VIRIFPNMEAAWRLIGALLAEHHEEWSTGRKYLDMTECQEWKQEISELESPTKTSPGQQPTIAV
jgi:transposase-like protein